METLIQHTGYDIFPVSLKLIVLDTTLSIKKALIALIQNGGWWCSWVVNSFAEINAAPLWNSKKRMFVGVLTFKDFIRLICNYHHSEITLDVALSQVEQIRLENLMGWWWDFQLLICFLFCRLEMETVKDWSWATPTTTLDQLALKFVQERVHYVLLSETGSGNSMVVGVMTPFRIIKFLAVNVEWMVVVGCSLLHDSVQRIRGPKTPSPRLISDHLTLWKPPSLTPP